MSRDIRLGDISDINVNEIIAMGLTDVFVDYVMIDKPDIDQWVNIYSMVLSQQFQCTVFDNVDRSNRNYFASSNLG